MIGLVGAGNMAKEIFAFILNSNIKDEIYFYDDRIKDGKLLYNKKEYEVKNKIDNNAKHIIAVGYPKTKVKITKDKEINWDTATYHLSSIMGTGIEVSEGSIIYPLCTLTTNIKIGRLASINSNVVIGHDVRIGEMFHACPGVVISGNCKIGDRVFMGANSCIREEIEICDDVIIGIGSVIINNIDKPGIYVGNPAKFLKNV